MFDWKLLKWAACCLSSRAGSNNLECICHLSRVNGPGCQITSALPQYMYMGTVKLAYHYLLLSDQNWSIRPLYYGFKGGLSFGVLLVQEVVEEII